MIVGKPIRRIVNDSSQFGMPGYNSVGKLPDIFVAVEIALIELGPGPFQFGKRFSSRSVSSDNLVLTLQKCICQVQANAPAYTRNQYRFRGHESFAHGWRNSARV